MKGRTETQGPTLEEQPHFQQEKKKSEIRKRKCAVRDKKRVCIEARMCQKERKNRKGCSTLPKVWGLRTDLWACLGRGLKGPLQCRSQKKAENRRLKRSGSEETEAGRVAKYNINLQEPKGTMVLD